jgi:hypothetical protein
MRECAVNSGLQNPSDLAPGALEPIRSALLHDGVALVPGIVPVELCLAACDAIDAWSVGLTDTAAGRRHARRGLVPLNQHADFWAIRQHPAVYALFRALLGTPFLWVTVDEGVHEPAGSNLPDDECFRWPLDPRIGGRHLRGMVILSDAREDSGLFRCVPHIFRNPDPWWSIYGIEPIPTGRIRSDQVLSVRGDVGSVIIWDARMPTTRGPNNSSLDRYAMHLAMDQEGDDERRKERLKNFEEGLPPAWARRLPGQPIPGSLGEPKLSDLGERLLGRIPW